MRVLIAGCGWLGRSVGRALLDRGAQVVGVRRDPGACRQLAECGFEALPLDLGDPGAGDSLPRDVDAILACQSAGGRSRESYLKAYVDLTRTLLDHGRANGISRFVYISSTGVFGQSAGRIVDEETPPAPADGPAQVLVDAERQVLEAGGEQGLGACVIRPSGLYGPERYGVLERVRRGSLALGDGDDRWTNWCHRADITQMTLAALDRGETGAVYHASDAAPTPRREVVEWISAALGIDAPRRGAGATGEAASRPVANRRISAESSRERLSTPLLYPSFREGLASGVAAITEG